MAADSIRQRNTSKFPIKDDVPDSKTPTYKKALKRLQEACDSYKKFAVTNGVTSTIATGIIDGYFRVAGMKIALSNLLSASARFTTIIGARCLAAVLSGGITIFLSFILDIGNCFVDFYRNKYCPTDKQLNRSLFLKQLRHVTASSVICSSITCGIGFLVCTLITTFGCMIAGLLCATGIGLLAKYAIQHKLRFGTLWGHKLKEYKYDEWAKKENEKNNNNTQDFNYKLWESLILFFDCVKEWEIERLMARCKLSIYEIEK